jgi:hypothetical protein
MIDLYTYIIVIITNYGFQVFKIHDYFNVMIIYADPIGRAADWLLGSRFRIPLRAWMFVAFICCVVLCK